MHFEISLILNAVIVFVEVVALRFLLNGFLEMRQKRVFYTVLMFGCYYVCALISVQFVGKMTVNASVTVLFPFLIAFILYSGDIWSQIIAAGLSISYHIITEPISAVLVRFIGKGVLLGNPDWDYLYFIGAAAAAALYMLIAVVLSRRRTARVYHLGVKNGVLLLMMVIVCGFLAFSVLLPQVANEINVTAVQFLSAIAIIGMAVFVYYAFERFQDSSMKELSATLLQRQMLDIRLQFDIIAAHEKEMQTLRHDFANHLSALESIAETNHQSGIDDVVRKISGRIEGATRQVITGITVIDALIEIKKIKAEKSGIIFDVKAGMVHGVVVDPVDLNIVLGNALDNAIEACARLPDEQACRIDFRMKTEDEFLYIRIDNTSLPITRIRNGFPLSSKRRGEKHGYGLESIKRMVERYNGIFLMVPSEGKFSLQIRMQNAFPLTRKNR